MESKSTPTPSMSTTLQDEVEVKVLILDDDTMELANIKKRTSSLQSVLLDHSNGKVAGVEEFSMVIKVEQEDNDEGGDGRDRWMGDNQNVKIENLEENRIFADNDLDGEQQRIENPVEVFLKVIKEEKCEESFELEEDMLKEHVTRNLIGRDEKHQYQESDARFSRKAHLMGHNRSQHGHTKLKCPEDNCNYEYHQQMQLQAHFGSKHGHAMLKCHFCNRLFNSRTNMVAHHKAVHHKCEQCDARFTWKEQLVRHIRSKHEHVKREKVVRPLQPKLLNGQVVVQSGDHDTTSKMRVQLHHCKEQSCVARFDRVEDLRAHHIVWHRSQHT